MKSKIIEKLNESKLKYITKDYNNDISFFYLIGELNSTDNVVKFYDSLIRIVGTSITRPNISLKDKDDHIKILKGNMDEIKVDDRIITLDIQTNKNTSDLNSLIDNFTNNYGEIKLLVKRLGQIDRFLGDYSIKVDIIFN